MPIENVIESHVKLLVDQPEPAGLEFTIHRTIVDTTRVDWSDPEYDHYYKVHGVARWTVWWDGENVYTWNTLFVEGIPSVEYELSLSYCSKNRFMEYVRSEVVGLVSRLAALTDQRAQEKLLFGGTDTGNCLRIDHQFATPMKVFVDLDDCTSGMKAVWRVLPDGTRVRWGPCR